MTKIHMYPVLFCEDKNRCSRAYSILCVECKRITKDLEHEDYFMIEYGD